MRPRAVLVGCVVLAGVAGLAVWLADAGDDGDGDRDVTVEPTAEEPPPEDRSRVRVPRPEVPEPSPPAPDATAETVPSATLVVSVVAAPDDRPLAGARVVLNPDGASPLVQETDAEGLTRFDDVVAGDVAVRAYADGHVRSGAAATLQAGETTTVEVRLARGVAVTGTVREERTERVIAGATVVVSPGGSVGGALMMRADAAYGGAETDERGRYRVDGIEPGEIVTVRARAAGHAPALESVILEPDATEPREVDLHLAPAGVVRGTVRMPGGVPAAGAQVFVISADSPESLRVNPTITSMGGGKTYAAIRGEAAEDGTFTVGGLVLDAAYDVLAILEEHGRTDVHEGATATALEPVVTVDLVVLPPPSLLVRVIDPEGEPETEGQLNLFGDGFPVPLEAGEPGEFTTAAAAAGHHTLRVTCPGAVIQEIPVDLVAGEAQELDVRLDRGLSLSGVLVDDAGAPVAGQTMIIGRHWSAAGELSLSEARATTDDEGRFSVSGLCEGPHGVILVVGRHDVPDTFRLEPPGDDIRIVVMRKAGLRALLRLPAGSAAPEQVAVRIGFTMESGVGWSGHSYAWNDGELVIDDLRVETTHVRIQVPAHLEIVREVKPTAGGIVDLGELTVERGFDLAGRVLDRAGGPVAGAQVSTGLVFTPGRLVAATDRDGRFLLRGVAEREATIEIAAEGFVGRSSVVSLPRDGEAWVVRLDEGCLVTLHVTDAAKKPAARRRVRATLVAADGTDTDETGVFVVDHRGVTAMRLRAGHWRIDALDDDYESIVATEIDAVEGGTQEVWLTLPR